MNKTKVADRLAARTGLSKGAARDAVDGVFAVIGEALANGEDVRLPGFGSFGTRTWLARTGRNPRTGEAVSIPASTTPTFRAGKTLKDTVKGAWGIVMAPPENIAPGSASSRLNMEPGRLLYDDGHYASCGGGAGKAEESRRVHGWPAIGSDAASRMRQESPRAARASLFFHSRFCSNRSIVSTEFRRPEIQGEYALELRTGRPKTRGLLRT